MLKLLEIYLQVLTSALERMNGTVLHVITGDYTVTKLHSYIHVYLLVGWSVTRDYAYSLSFYLLSVEGEK